MSNPVSVRWRRREIWLSLSILLCSNECLVSHSFLIKTQQHHPMQSCRVLSSTRSGDSISSVPAACIVGYFPLEEQATLIDALRMAGYSSVQESREDSYRYAFSKATGMLRLVQEPEKNRISNAPKWIPLVKGEENVLVANGWSFLDPDENEPLSAFDVDAANLEGQYRPKWGESNELDNADSEPVSSLGFSLRQLSPEKIQQEDSSLHQLSRSVLLEGATDPPHRKITSNGHDFSGSTSQCDIQRGVFVCAIGGLPLFTTLNLSPTTASSGWLSFSQPVSDDHVVLVKPLTNALDQRIEVLCAKTKCHLGHYFGKGNGYCINASALNFVASEATFHHDLQFKVQVPVSWRSLEARECESSSVRLLQHVCLAATPMETLVFGAECFWHVEFSLRRLPGVILTETGYAGGTTMSPTYESVCCTDTGHAEVVRVTFDPHVLSPKILMDCFLAFHDPTMVRAVGKHSQGTGQYRSCIFVTSHEMEGIAREALNDCRRQLNKDLSTHVCRMDMDVDSWFWKAEEQHQRHDEKCGDKNNLSTLSITEWLGIYGQRKETIWGSSHTISTLTSID